MKLSRVIVTLLLMISFTVKSPEHLIDSCESKYTVRTVKATKMLIYIANDSQYMTFVHTSVGGRRFPHHMTSQEPCVCVRLSDGQKVIL